MILQLHHSKWLVRMTAILNNNVKPQYLCLTSHFLLHRVCQFAHGLHTMQKHLIQTRYFLLRLVGFLKIPCQWRCQVFASKNLRK